MPLPEGFIMPTLGVSVGSNVMKATPTAEAVAGAMGTISAEILRHKEYNAKKSEEIAKANLPGLHKDDIEVVIISSDKFTKTPLRASNLSNPAEPFHCELSIEQQVQLAELRERFRRNEHGTDTPIAMWEALNAGEQYQLVAMGVLYVEQLAAYKEHEYYKLGNNGPELVKRAQRHLAAQVPNKQEEFEQQMSQVLAARAEEKARADELERKYFAMQEQLAALQSDEPKAKRGRPPKPGVQEIGA